MKFGLFYNPMVPRIPGELDWEPGADSAAFKSMLEQIQLADRLGVDYVFLGEHHFLPEYAHNSATEVLLGAIAATTTQIRIGTAITQMSHNQPIRTAERIAMADIVSGGRIEFGFGPGSSEEIGPLLNGNADQKRELSAAASQVAVDILGCDGAWSGCANDYFNYPPLQVVPKAVQRPHPPLWTSTAAPGAAPGVAERGLGQLMLTLAGPEAVKAEVDLYWDSLHSLPIKPVGQGVNPALFTFACGLLAQTDEEAEARAREGIEFFGFGLTGGAPRAITEPSQHHLWDAFVDFKAGRGDIRQNPRVSPMMLEMGSHFADLPGTMMSGPETARKFVRSMEAANADGLLLNQQFGRTKHEHLMESIEIFATEVIPEFREREAEHDAWRAKQLESVGHPIVSSL